MATPSSFKEAILSNPNPKNSYDITSSSENVATMNPQNIPTSEFAPVVSGVKNPHPL